MTTIDVAVRIFRVEITATTEIAASTDRTWAVLADTAAYPQWNPFVRRLDGSLAVGETIEVDLQADQSHRAGGVQTMRPRIVALEPGRSFSWLGRVGLPGVLDGRHTFTVEPDGAGSRLVQHEVLSGVLTPFFRTVLTRQTPEAFVALNDALAARAVADR
jgi:hypothetical protein